jgi:tight adherence protein B
MTNSPMLVAGMVAIAIGGLAFVFLGGDSLAKRRQAALQKASVANRDNNSADKNARKKQIADSLKDLEKKRGRKRVDIATKLQQAGIAISKQQYLLASLASGLLIGLLTYLKSGSYIIAPMAGLIGAVGLPNFVVNWMRKRRIKKFVNIFPNAMDIIVRGIKAGLPLGDCLRVIASETQEPVRSEFRLIIETQQLGLPIAEAVERLPHRVPIPEANFFAIVIAIQAKAGGNLSEALGNLSRVLRERKKMRGKITAMAMEAKASAIIIGIVPFVVTFLLYLSAPAYISLLWTTTHGKIITAIALSWMSIGMAMMKKMIAFDF